MNYTKFLMTRIIKNRKNFLTIIILFLLCSFMLLLSYSSSRNNVDGLEQMASSNIVYAEENIPLMEQRYNQIPEGLEKEKYAKNLKDYKLEYEQNKLIVDYIKQDEWLKVYKEKYSQELNNEKNIDEDVDLDFIPIETSEYYKYYVDNGLNIYPQLHPNSSVSFPVYIWESLVPTILTFSIIFALVNLMEGMFKETVFIDKIVPINNKERIFIYIKAGILLSLILFIGMLLYSSVIAGITSSIGSLKEGYMFYDISSNSYIWNSILLLIAKSIILQLLSFVFICLTVVLITIILKNVMQSLLISSLVLIGPVFLIGGNSLLTNYAFLLPTTYLQSVSVVTGSTSKIVGYDITFLMGIVILMISIGLLCLVIYIILNKSMIRRKFHELL